MSKVKVWIQDLEWVRTKVSLEGEGLSFGEIYMNGGTLDLSGLTLKFDQIKANSNNVFITSSKAGANLNLENKQNYLYHGNIYNKEGVFKAENAKLNFQGHPSIHAYVSEKQAKKLQEQGLSALTKPVSFAQEDWEDRVFVLKELNLDQSKFYLERNASLKVENLNAKNSKIELGSKHLWIDEKDGENITDKVQDSFYGDTAQTGVGKEMGFEQKL